MKPQVIGLENLVKFQECFLELGLGDLANFRKQKVVVVEEFLLGASDKLDYLFDAFFVIILVEVWKISLGELRESGLGKILVGQLERYA